MSLDSLGPLEKPLAAPQIPHYLAAILAQILNKRSLYSDFLDGFEKKIQCEVKYYDKFRVLRDVPKQLSEKINLKNSISFTEEDLDYNDFEEFRYEINTYYPSQIPPLFTQFCEWYLKEEKRASKERLQHTKDIEGIRDISRLRDDQGVLIKRTPIFSKTTPKSHINIQETSNDDLQLISYTINDQDGQKIENQYLYKNVLFPAVDENGALSFLYEGYGGCYIYQDGFQYGAFQSRQLISEDRPNTIKLVREDFDSDGYGDMIVIYHEGKMSGPYHNSKLSRFTYEKEGNSLLEKGDLLAMGKLILSVDPTIPPEKVWIVVGSKGIFHLPTSIQWTGTESDVGLPDGFVSIEDLELKPLGEIGQLESSE